MNLDGLIEYYFFAIRLIGVRYLMATVSAFAIFYLVFHKFFRGRKIQLKFPKKWAYLRDFMFSVQSILIFGFFSILTFRIFPPYSQLYWEMEEHSQVYYFFSLICMFFMHDAYFYFVHRLMHWKKIYRWVHKVHHLSTNPSPWTAYAFHPLEALLEASVIPLMTFVMPIHPSVVGMLMLFQIFYNVYGHLGYELLPRRFHKTWVGRYVNTSVAHNLHHSRFTGNFGLYTLIWDRLLGTIREDYDESYDSVFNKT